MLLEFRRNSAAKELSVLTSELESAKVMLANSAQVNSRQEEDVVKRYGITQEEVGISYILAESMSVY